MRPGVPRGAVSSQGPSGQLSEDALSSLLRSGSLEQVFWEQPLSQASVGIFPTAFLGPGRRAELRVPVSACGELLLAQKKKEPAVLRPQRDILGDLNPEGGRVSEPGSSPMHSTFSCPRCQRLGHCLLPATNEIREAGPEHGVQRPRF